MLISEFLPNPKGSDEKGEFIELKNESSKSVSLNGYRIEDKSGKKFFLKGEAGPGGYVLLPRTLTKIALNNRNEGVYLYGPGGQLSDKAEFSGDAPEGSSYARDGGVFRFTGQPTPGAANVFEEVAGLEPGLLIENPPAEVINALPYFQAIAVTLAVSIVLSWLFMHIIRNAEEEGTQKTY